MKDENIGELYQKLDFIDHEQKRLFDEKTAILTELSKQLNRENEYHIFFEKVLNKK